MAQGASILSGIMRGLAQGKLMEREEARNKPLLDLQKMKLKLSQDESKLKMQEMKLKQSLLDMVVKRYGGDSIGQPTQEGPPSSPQKGFAETGFSENFPSVESKTAAGGDPVAEGLQDQIAQGQMPVELLQVMALMSGNYAGAGNLGLRAESLKEQIENNRRLNEDRDLSRKIREKTYERGRKS